MDRSGEDVPAQVIGAQRMVPAHGERHTIAVQAILILVDGFLKPVELGENRRCQGEYHECSKEDRAGRSQSIPPNGS